MAKLLRFQFKFIIFWAYVPHLKFLQWKQWHLNLLWVPEYLGDNRPEIKKNGFQNAYFFRSYFPIQNTCNWVSHSAIAYAYGSKMWRASSLIISRNVRKHRACIKQRNLQWRCGSEPASMEKKNVIPPSTVSIKESWICDFAEIPGGALGKWF